MDRHASIFNLTNVAMNGTGNPSSSSSTFNVTSTSAIVYYHLECNDA